MKINAQDASLFILIGVVTFFLSYALMPDGVELRLEFKKIGLSDSQYSSTSEPHESNNKTPEYVLDSLDNSIDNQSVDITNRIIDYTGTSFMPDRSRQRILFIGDSMLEGLSLRLNDYAAQDRNYLMTVIWYASGTRHWGSTDSLAMLIDQYRPTYIFISCGGNELAARNVNSLKPYIKNIVNTCGDIPFIWIGPPNWHRDTGINDAIRSIVGEKRFFDSSNMKLARQADHIHPTYQAAAIWMDSIASWVSSDQTANPIQMTYPTVKAQKRNLRVFKRAG